jgi:hypothetical protein
MSEFQDQVYLLENNLNRFRNVERGEGYDLEAFSFEEVMQVRYSVQSKILNLPDPTFFYRNKGKDFLYRLDSLAALEGCPIFSQKMIDVLLSVRKFNYKKYPIAVLDDRDLNPYEDIHKYKELSLRNDLFIFQTLEFLDLFDWEKSKYTQEDFDKDMNIPTYIREFVLKTPKSGFPPLFRLPFKSTNLFISREAREALRRAGITGTAFTLLSRPRGNSEIDVPIDMLKDLHLEHEVDQHQQKINKTFAEAKRERLKGNDARADRLEQKAHDLMRDIGY